MKKKQSLTIPNEELAKVTLPPVSSSGGFSIRKPLSKKIRFEVFKRDNFKCQYCGKKVPEIILEIDHIVPVVDGGDNRQSNLLTSCFECNRGKSKNRIDNKICRDDIKELNKQMKEKKKQLAEYYSLLQEEQNQFEVDYLKIRHHWRKYFEIYDDKQAVSIRNMLKRSNVFTICECIDLFASKEDYKKTFSYFCGICWNKINGKGYGK